MTSFFLRILFSCLLLAACLYAGPNSSASMAIDFAPETPAADSIDTFTAATTVSFAVTVAGAVNLDAYQFDLRYDTTILKFKSAMEDNPFASLDNILKLKGGATVGFICQPKPGTTGVLNIANTLVGEDSAQAPEGGGIIAILIFTVVKQQTCSLFVEKGYAVDYEQVKDSVKTYSPGVIRAATTPILFASTQQSCLVNRISDHIKPAIVDVLGRRISYTTGSHLLTISNGHKIVTVKKNRSNR
jgi:hypothetical protein